MLDRFNPERQSPLSDTAIARRDAALSKARAAVDTPHPPDELMFVGGGDFKAVGQEVLGRIAAHTGLLPNHTVLDVGAGSGRLAVPMSSYLSKNGRYIGLEPVKKAVDWCAQAIGAVHPNFKFKHVPWHHPDYNPVGRLDPSKARWPVESGSVDRIASVSVFTHLSVSAIRQYALESCRCLKPGGVLFGTFFLIDEWSLKSAMKEPLALKFKRDGRLNAWVIDPDKKLAAIGFRPEQIEEVFKTAGLVDFGGITRGHWSGVASLQGDAPYQDIWCWQKPQ